MKQLNKLNKLFNTITEQFEGTPQQKVWEEFNDPDYYNNVYAGLRDLEGKSVEEIQANSRIMLRLQNTSPIIVQGIASEIDDPDVKLFLQKPF